MSNNDKYVRKKAEKRSDKLVTNVNGNSISKQYSVNGEKTTGKSNLFSSELKRASMSKDSIEIKHETFEQKMQRLKEEGANIDYTGMTDTEIYKSIRDRYMDTFEDYARIEADIYRTDLEDQMTTQCFEEIRSKVSMRMRGEKFASLYKESIFGGMTDEAITQSIIDKYSGKGTIMDKLVVLDQLARAGVMDRRLEFDLNCSIRREAEIKACKDRGIDYITQGMDDPRKVQWTKEYMSGTKVTWDSVIDDFLKSPIVSKEDKYKYIPKLKVITDKLCSETDFYDKVV